MSTEEAAKAAALDMPGKIRRFSIGAIDGYVIDGYRDGQLAHVDIFLGLQGEADRKTLDLALRFVRLALDLGAPVSEVLKRLRGSQSDCSGIAPGIGIVSSPEDLAARVIEQHMGDQ